MSLGEVCSHGALKRQCYTCELEEERDRLREQVQTLEKAFEKCGYAFQDAVNKALLERNHYKSLAGKMAEALSKIDRSHDESECGFCGSKRIAKEALVLYAATEPKATTKENGQ